MLAENPGLRPQKLKKFHVYNEVDCRSGYPEMLHYATFWGLCHTFDSGQIQNVSDLLLRLGRSTKIPDISKFGQYRKLKFF